MSSLVRMLQVLPIRKAVVTLVLLLRVSCAPALLQEITPTDREHFDRHWTQFTITDGLPQNSVTALAQTLDGYLWIGTQGGLARFDGVRFTLFDIANTPQLKQNRIVSLLGASNGDLWISTTAAGVLRLRDGDFVSYRDLQDAPQGTVVSIVEDVSGAILFAGSNLVRYVDGSFHDLKLQDGIPNATQVMAILPVEDGRTWIGTPHGLGQLQGNGWQTIDDLQEASNRNVGFLGMAPSGVAWACGTDWMIDLTHDRFLSFDSQDNCYGLIRAAVTDLRRDYWLGSDQGLFCQHPFSETGRSQGALQFDRVEIPVESGQPSVRSLFEDREGNLWIGTVRQGLFRMRESPFRSSGAVENKRATFPRFLGRDAQGGFWSWLITKDHLDHFVDKQWTKVPFPPDVQSPNCVTIAADGTLWISHQSKFLSAARGDSSERFEHSLGRIHQMIETSGTIWLATDKGLATFVDGTFKLVPDGVPRSPFHPDTVLAPSSTGVLWIGHDNVVTEYRDGDFVRHSLAATLPNGGIRAIHQSIDGTVWISTYGGGLIRLKDDELTRYTVQDGLPDNSLGKIIEDESGALWINSNRGVFRIRRNELDGFADGRLSMVTALLLPTGEGNSSQGAASSDGSIWFPTLAGTIQIIPQKVLMNDVPPNVVLEKVIADGILHDVRGAIRAVPGNGGLVIEYTAPSFVEPNHVRFKYMLEGFDPQFIEAGTERVARYTKVPPGNYRFRVLASNESGLWSTHETRLDITLTPHFYETTLFRILVLLSILGVAVLYLNSRRKQFSLLSNREERLRAIVSSLHESAIIVVYDRDGTVTALWGTEQLNFRHALARADAIGMRLDELLPTDQAAAIHNEINQVFETGHGRIVTHLGSFHDDPVWHESSYAPLQDGHGKTVAVVTFIRDITDRKQAEGALQQSEARFRALFDTSVDAIILSTRDGTLVAANAAAHSLYGYTQGEMTRVHATQLYADPSDRSWAQSQLETHGVIQNVERKLRRKDGTEFDAILSATLRRNPAGDVIGYQSIVHDISERKRAEDIQRQLEEQLRHAQKMDAVGTLAAGVAHDFNNYLMAIIGYAYKAEACSQGNEGAAEAVSGIRQAAQQAAALTRSLLSFSRSEGFRREPIDLVSVVNDAVNLVRHSIPATVEVISQIPANEPVWIEGDATQLRQLVMNLALNARDAMPDGGCLRVEIKPDPQETSQSTQNLKRYATLIVRDNGIGMTDEVASRIFDPFFTTRARERGTGLGMAVVHRIVQNHHGRIEVESKPASGTCMTVTLPMCGPAEQTPSHVSQVEALADSSNNNGKLILLAEDNPHVRPLLASSLEAAGFTVIVAADGREALDAIKVRHEDLDFLVLDVDLPFIPGTDCLQVARQLSPDLPAVLISGLSEAQDKADQLGATLLPKPFIIKDLIDVIEDAIG